MRPHTTFSDSLAGHIQAGAATIKLTVRPDGELMEKAIALAMQVVGDIVALDARARALIAAEFLESYNSHWRFGDVEREVPALNVVEFCDTLSFEEVEATGSGMVTLWYGDGDMFAGHNLYVSSFDGVTMKDVNVSMFG
jgi:hypothetical protein